MVEEVETGGLMRFRYSGEQAKLGDKEKKEIELAYQKSDERKRKERAIKRLIWISGITFALLIIVALYFFLK